MSDLSEKASLIYLYINSRGEKMTLTNMLLGTLLGMVVTTWIIKILIGHCKEIREIRMSSDDVDIMATVDAWRIHYTGDIMPVAKYIVDGEKKIYKFHFFYHRKKYPIGKEITLKLSNSSGLAYDKKDLTKEITFWLFFLLFFGLGTLCSIILLIAYFL